jgi:hypothetical protein
MNKAVLLNGEFVHKLQSLAALSGVNPTYSTVAREMSLVGIFTKEWFLTL